MAVRIDGQEILKTKSFQNLGSIFHKDREIEEEVNHKISSRWIKWRSTSGVLYDHRLPFKLKGKKFKTTIQLAMLYGTKWWAVT